MRQKQTDHARSRPTTKQAKYLRQSISVTGLGIPEFETNIKGLADIYSAFARCVMLDKLAPSGIVDEYNKQSSIELSNRYFTSKKEALLEDCIAISTDIDPQGLLVQAAGNNYVHTEQNAVKYYMRTKEKDNNRFVQHYWKATS